VGTSTALGFESRLWAAPDAERNDLDGRIAACLEDPPPGILRSSFTPKPSAHSVRAEIRKTSALKTV
jgi:hypothetical protein